MKCITLTLNPAFDRHCFVPNFRLYHEHLATSDSCEAGGKGVNISRAMCSNGVDNLAIVVMGKENEAQFSQALKNDNLNFVGLIVEGRVRENLTIHTNGAETRVSFEGFKCGDGLLEDVYDMIENQLDSETIVTFTGRVPSGVSMPAVMNFLERIEGKGTRVVIDSRSFSTLDALISARPWLIKPNQEEISEYLGREIQTHEEIVEVAESIRKKGIENVMVSLGAKGALLVCADGAYICTPPKISARSSIGAGDSSIGGFVAAIMEGLDKKAALCRSVAYGTAACMRDGTLPPLKKDVDKILAEVNLNEIRF